MRTRIKKIWIDDVAIYIETPDGQIFSEKFEDYPRLRHATPEQRAAFEYNNILVHWEDLDEDLGVEYFMTDQKRISPP
jgi:hypothetical protein